MKTTLINKEKLAQDFGVKTLESLPGDVSPRKYFRGRKGDHDFIIMAYPDATDENRQELHDFIRIGAWLSEKGIKTPALYNLDEQRCIAQFEDLGRTSFGQQLRGNLDQQEHLYTLATDILKILNKAGTLENMRTYRDGRIHENRRQIVDYYIPFIRKEQSNAALVNDYLAVWDEIEQNLPPCPQGFVHGDYHLENLMYMPDEKDIKQCALIDYQGALHGPLPYDLVNLLEDARADIPRDLREYMVNHYCAEMDSSTKNTFLKWYRVLGTQFHCRVIGLFIKLSEEQGRDAYLIHIPRLQNYIIEALKDPLLHPLKEWFEKEGVDFRPIKDLDGNRIRKFFKT